MSHQFSRVPLLTWGTPLDFRQRKAINLKPNYFTAYNNRGDVERRLGNYPKAASDLGKAIELDTWKPEDSGEVTNYKFGLYVSLGDIQMYLGQYEESLDSYESASTIEPENEDVPAFKGNALVCLGKLSKGLKLRRKSFGFICFDLAEGASIVQD